jgi:hypothetical protein
MSETKYLVRREYWDAENDRWILTTLNAHGEAGLNFMQGDDYKTFKGQFGEPDPKLSALYNVVMDNKIIDDVVPEIEAINRVCWAYLKLKLGT